MVMQPEEELLEKAVVRLNTKLLGIVLGFVLGIGLFLATNILVIKGGPNVGQHLSLLGQFFPGYEVTFLGSIIGFLYAFAVGFIIGAVLGAVYNKVARA
jgi:ABC-type nitrate/sulfonate/bicarbonate transport system permease component